MRMRMMLMLMRMRKSGDREGAAEVLFVAKRAACVHSAWKMKGFLPIKSAIW